MEIKQLLVLSKYYFMNAHIDLIFFKLHCVFCRGLAARFLSAGKAGGALIFDTSVDSWMSSPSGAYFAAVHIWQTTSRL